MNLTVCEDEHNHILVYLFLDLVALFDCQVEEYVEVSGSTEFQIFHSVTVRLHDALDHVHVGIIDIAIEGKAVVDLTMRVEVGHHALRPKTVYWHQLIVVVVKQNAGDLLQSLFIRTLLLGMQIVQGFRICNWSIAGSEINAGDEH